MLCFDGSELQVYHVTEGQSKGMSNDKSQIPAPQQHKHHIRDNWPDGRHHHGFPWRLMPLTIEALAAMDRAQSRHIQSHFYG